MKFLKCTFYVHFILCVNMVWVCWEIKMVDKVRVWIGSVQIRWPVKVGKKVASVGKLQQTWGLTVENSMPAVFNQNTVNSLDFGPTSQFSAISKEEGSASDASKLTAQAMICRCAKVRVFSSWMEFWQKEGRSPKRFLHFRCKYLQVPPLRHFTPPFWYMASSLWSFHTGDQDQFFPNIIHWCWTYSHLQSSSCSWAPS